MLAETRSLILPTDLSPVTRKLLEQTFALTGLFPERYSCTYGRTLPGGVDWVLPPLPMSREWLLGEKAHALDELGWRQRYDMGLMALYGDREPLATSDGMSRDDAFGAAWKLGQEGRPIRAVSYRGSCIANTVIEFWGEVRHAE